MSAGPDLHEDASIILIHTFQQSCTQFRLIRLKGDHPECGDDSTFLLFSHSRLNIFTAGELKKTEKCLALLLTGLGMLSRAGICNFLSADI